MSFTFSYLFDPFVVNTSEHRINHFWILLIHAFLPFPISFIYFSIVNYRLNLSKVWTLGNEILHLSLLLLLIGVIDFLIRDLIYSNPNNWSFQYFFEEIRNTFLIGSLLLLILLPLNLERLIKKHSHNLTKLTLKKIKEDAINNFIIIKTANINEQVQIDINDFIFAKVESNYTEVFIKNLNNYSKILIRITLKELEEQLKTHTSICKTHRSYLVNLNQIDSVSGNAQGYNLTLKNYTTTIPVSRSNISKFNALYSTM
ncbi:LytTR family DNA-binding domain-containing protein [Tenacibaculum sp.]|nr:LytTR family DNA-binding domain-containing protein [Tenacibaculum sp.]